MSDIYEGPDQRMASDGKWYPSELQPSSGDASRMQTAERPRHDAVQASPPERDGAPPPGRPGAGRGSEPAGHPTPGGRQFPDLFQKALQGSHLADNVTVRYDGDDERNQPGASSTSPAWPEAGSRRTVTSGGRTPVAAGTAGVTFAAPAKRKWRKGR